MKIKIGKHSGAGALISSLTLGLLSITMVSVPAMALETTGVPGSPSATTTISGTQLPAPDAPFGGKIERNATQSKPYWPAKVVPPKDAPNVLLIMLDDVGFGAPSTFGGVIPTPALDRIAADGLRYTNFHSTALCSPTRAALITGRNHHSVGAGGISETSTGYPGYDSIIPKSKASIGTILKDNGYMTSWFGKNHTTPVYQASQVGPFDQWPVGLGFDYFYGFIGGDTNQWQPGNLFRNTTPIYPYVNNPSWNLTTATADDAIQHMRQLDALAPQNKWFIMYTPGGTHAPYHPTPEWIEKISAMHLFDKGWNEVRKQIFENQKKLGVIPQTAKLTPWPNKLLKQWDELTPDQKKLYIRQADIYAAFLAYTDHEVGRVIQEVQNEGKLDNTLIIYISGDNGASPEGNMDGAANEVALFNGVHVPVEVQLKKHYDDWGSDKTYPHMAAAWAWMFSTPFSWTKQVASHFGGTKQGVAISWPKEITDKGGIRWQFHHVIDIVPTILEAAGIPAPKEVNGIKQAPIEGVSMMYTFPKANADVPSHHHTQYFEIMGDHAIYHDGWIASSKVMRPPWVLIGKANQDPANYPWELYDLNKDWTQYDDVAAQHPKKLAELQKLFWSEASKNNVLPLDASVAARLINPKPNISAGRNVFTYSGKLTGTPNAVAPNILAASYNFKAEVEIPKDGADGMIVTEGGRFAGYGFYVLHSKPVFVWNMFDLQRIRWEGKDALSPGKHTIEFDFQYDGLGLGTLAFNNLSGIGQGGTGVLKVDGDVVATNKMAHTIPIIVEWDESFDVGADTGTPVDDQDYQIPFEFTGKLDKLTLTINRPKLSPADIKKLTDAANGNTATD